VGVVDHSAEEYVASVVERDVHDAHLAHSTHAVQDTHASVVHEEVDIHVSPTNLPTAGYDTLFGDAEVHEEKEDEVQFGALENKAHEHKVLLSSDAMRYFVKHVSSYAEQNDMFEAVVQKARVSFPSEEGWVVLNLERMERLVEEVKHTHVREAEFVNTTLENSTSYAPMSAGSLAEAIVTKNIVAAYQLMANRPMIALADAASDLNAVYRGRKGESVTVSNLLEAHTREMSTDTLESLTLALTSALDGTYSTEEEAVKMAILKAVQVIS
jgi:hypothetical protein